MFRFHVATLSLLLFFACSGPEAEAPSVQASSKASPRGGLVISLNRIVSGHFRAIAPRCVGERFQINLPKTGDPGSVVPVGGLPIRPGDTAEFRNYMPEVPANVTSLEGPSPLFSPNLVKPYNFVREGEDAFSFWRFTFPRPGVYEFFDTNMGEPGRKVVDAYYGTVTFVGESNAPKGVVCVDEPGCTLSLECLNGTAPKGSGCCVCPGVCCDLDTQCGAGDTCFRGRCIDASSLEDE